MTVMARFKAMGVHVVLDERVLQWPSHPEVWDGELKTVTTLSGHSISAELVLPCTGQTPRVSLLKSLDPTCISPLTGRIQVKPTLQVLSTRKHNESDEKPVPDLNHIFAAGDVADTGAIQAGHTAYFQGTTAAYNILRLIDATNGDPTPLEEYTHSGPAIKVTLGRVS